MGTSIRPTLVEEIIMLPNGEEYTTELYSGERLIYRRLNLFTFEIRFPEQNNRRVVLVAERLEAWLTSPNSQDILSTL